MKNAIILCSGGLDSVTTAYHVKKNLSYKKITILFFNYHQKSLRAERKCSKQCAKQLGAKFIEMDLPELAKISNSLINKGEKINKLNPFSLKDTKNESKKWYVPCRNLVFLSYSLALADSIFIKTREKSDVFIGFKNEGKEHYPDTTSAFLKTINKVSKVSTAGFKILAPLIEKDKEDIILFGKKLGVNFKKTFSCYASERLHCGNCLACRLRKAGFYWANEKDQTKYH